MQNKIKIIDSMTGSGKTSKIIDMINNDFPDDRRFIYITPFLDEVERIKKSVTTRRVYEPKQLGEGKLANLKDMIIADKDIASTHALFEMADDELMTLIETHNYTLILDEVMNVIEQVSIHKDDLKLLIKNDIITVGSDNKVTWNDRDDFQNTHFKYIRQIAKNDNLFVSRGSALMWTFPIRCFKVFTEVYVLTYMFKAQMQRYYYDMFDIEYKYLEIQQTDDKYEIVPYGALPIDRSFYRDNIHIYDGKLNHIGKGHTLSSTWLKDEGKKNQKSIKQLKDNIYSYFTNNTKSRSDSNMWTTLLHSKEKLKGRGYTKGFVEHNARATNQYSHKTNLVYAMNKFMIPTIRGFFEDRQIPVDEDAWALSELIQWVWRSAIRNNQPINIYIPSERMRKLFIEWLNEK